jgi:hypothetical protein
MTFPDLGAELDRLFPGWRTWNEPNPPPRKEEDEPTVDDKWRKFIEKEEEREDEGQ